MRILGLDWLDGYLDETLQPGHVRIKVLKWRTLAPVPGLYFVPERDPRMVLNYVTEVGLLTTVRKILSRSRETLRNEKFVSCGLGVVTETGTGATCHPGKYVHFIAPAHPRCMERVVLPAALTSASSSPAEATYSTSGVSHIDLDANFRAPWLPALAGWSPYSGLPLPEDTLRLAHEAIPGLLTDAGRVRSLPTDSGVVQERIEPKTNSDDTRPSAALFGFGNYAKTVVLPIVNSALRVECVHELDPTQIGRDTPSDIAFDSSPFPRDDERYKAILIAGFHHTHADIAIEAMRRGAAAVVEKPVVTTESQLDRLLEAVQTYRGRLFACFQRRYLAFNARVRHDLGVAPDAPISYHATVFEVPLPAAHWYRWPNSRSRLVSNGCHWIDHFLFLNHFGAIEQQDVYQARDGTLNVSLELENGAVFTMVLTERGANRIGLQDHVELRTAQGTATITNASRYRAERGKRIVRTCSGNRMDAYRQMYRTIARAVVNGSPGDSLASIESSSRTILRLERELKEQLRVSRSQPP